MFQFCFQVKKDSILSDHVVCTFFFFLPSNTMFSCVLFIFIGQMNPVIIHYDSRDLTGPWHSHLLGTESPGAMTRACQYHF